jgi:hypothetical protein
MSSTHATRQTVRFLAVLALTFTCTITPALAQDTERAATSPAPANEAIDTSRRHIELSIGYGITFALAARFHDDEIRQFTVVSPRFGLFAHSFDIAPPLKGTFELMASLDLFSQFAPNGRTGFGFGPLFRYNFWTGTRVVPFLDFGFGLNPNDFGHPEQGGHFAFELQGGAGLQVFLVEGVALTLEYRFHHVSSAFIYEPNYGINTSVISVGTALFF